MELFVVSRYVGQPPQVMECLLMMAEGRRWCCSRVIVELPRYVISRRRSRQGGSTNKACATRWEAQPRQEASGNLAPRVSLRIALQTDSGLKGLVRGTRPIRSSKGRSCGHHSCGKTYKQRASRQVKKVSKASDLVWIHAERLIVRYRLKPHSGRRIQWSAIRLDISPAVEYTTMYSSFHFQEP